MALVGATCQVLWHVCPPHASSALLTLPLRQPVDHRKSQSWAGLYRCRDSGSGGRPTVGSQLTCRVTWLPSIRASPGHCHLGRSWATSPTWRHSCVRVSEGALPTAHISQTHWSLMYKSGSCFPLTSWRTPFSHYPNRPSPQQCWETPQVKVAYVGHPLGTSWVMSTLGSPSLGRPPPAHIWPGPEGSRPPGGLCLWRPVLIGPQQLL